MNYISPDEGNIYLQGKSIRFRDFSQFIFIVGKNSAPLFALLVCHTYVTKKKQEFQTEFPLECNRVQSTMFH